MAGSALEATDINKLVGQILRPDQKQRFEQTKSLDFSMGYLGQAHYRIHQTGARSQVKEVC